MNETIVEHDGKRWRHRELPSGAIIESQIVEEFERPIEDSEELKLIKRIAEKLGVEVDE